MLQTPIDGMVNNSQEDSISLDVVLAEKKEEKGPNASPDLNAVI